MKSIKIALSTLFLAVVLTVPAADAGIIHTDVAGPTPTPTPIISVPPDGNGANDDGIIHTDAQAPVVTTIVTEAAIALAQLLMSLI